MLVWLMPPGVDTYLPKLPAVCSTCWKIPKDEVLKTYSGENLPRTHARPTFAEAWFQQRYGLDFGERYYRDPIFRTE